MPRASSRTSRERGYRGDREGIAIYALPDGTGYIVGTDQLDEDSEYHLYPREGAQRATRTITRAKSRCFAAAPMRPTVSRSRRARSGPGSRTALLIAMNSAPRNFLVFRWQDVAAAVTEPKNRR